MSEFMDDKYVTEEELHVAIINETARNLHPNVPPHITIGLYMLRDKIKDVADSLASKSACTLQMAELEDCICMAGDILNAVSDAFSHSGGNCDGTE